jgi:DNA-binding CsgD family transcriptional regulator
VSDTTLVATRMPTSGEGTVSLPQASPVSGANPTTIPASTSIQKVSNRRRRPREPKDSKVRRTAMAIVALRAQGMKVSDAAAQLGIKPETASVYLYRAHKKGWLLDGVFDDPSDNLEYVLKSKVVKNIGEMLQHGVFNEKSNPLGCVGDREVTLEVAKGLGMLKVHAVTKAEGAPAMSALQVNVIMPVLPEGSKQEAIRPGSCGGTPIFDVQVMEEE